MARRFEAIVFDWDGTLMDSTSVIAGALRSAARDMNFAPPSIDMARHVIGLGLEDALRRAIPELDPACYPALSERFGHHYRTGDGALQLFGGVRELLGELGAAGYLLAVATGKSRRGLARAFEVTGAANLFHATRCADECHSKPHPQMLHELLRELGVAPESMLMIGDTSHDLQMAANAGVAGLGVSYGAHPGVELLAYGPCVDSIAELAAWLRSNG